MEQAPLFDFPGKGNDFLKAGKSNSRKKSASTKSLKVIHPVKQKPEEANEKSLREELIRAKMEVEAAYKAMASLNKDLTDSINYSKHIQEAILPAREILYDFAREAFFFYKPKSIVSGDFYWFTKYDNKILVAVVDCTGHGVPGAFMSMIGHNLLNEIVNVKDISQPAEILNRLDRAVRSLLKQDGVRQGTNDGMDIAICSIDPEKGVLEFAGANRPVILMQSSGLTEIKGDKASIGGSFCLGGQAFTNHEVNINRGDKLYLFTDGYADQFGGAKNKKMLKRRFRQLLRLLRPLKLKQQEKIILRYFQEWQGDNEQTDDVLVIGMTI